MPWPKPARRLFSSSTAFRYTNYFLFAFCAGVGFFHACAYVPASFASWNSLFGNPGHSEIIEILVDQTWMARCR
jgi:hypothetical protein